MDPLRQITVLSLEQATVLPYLTYRLVQDGVKVIRLEHPVFGDPNRLVGDNVLNEDRMNSYFMPINAGKKALTLNLGGPEGQQILKDLIVKLQVDIFATNQLPKNYGKLGIAYEILKAVKPDLIWLGITGFGPDSNEAAYDPILQARGGLMELTGEPDGEPQVLGIPLPDMGASEHAYGLLMKALFRRQATGQGARIDLAMFDSTVSWLTVPITLSRTFGKKITRRGNTHEFFSPVSVYPTADGYVYVAGGNDKQWAALTQVPGFEALNKEAYQKNAGRIADVKNLNRELAAATRKYTSAELIEIFNRIGVPISQIHDMEQVGRDPLVVKNLLKAKDPKSGLTLTLAPPPQMTDYLQSIGQELPFPPRFGEHNGEIYGEALGIGPDQLREMKGKGII
ncbi:MAG: CoA transferase [Deltaproteobacteria bacterium]|nr:CoA transferase [Deltaproteobacteria bacterium]